MSLTYNKSLVKVLVTDDEDSIRGMLVETLKEDGWSVDFAKNGKEALEKIKTNPVHIIVSDINMPEMTGTELLEQVKKIHPQTEFVIMTSHATLETAVKAVQLGAYDYLHKPFEDISVVSKKLEQVAEKILLRQQNQELLKRLKLAGHELKKLLMAITPLNGVLEEEDLPKVALEGLGKLFEASNLKASWWRHFDGQWSCVESLGLETKPELVEDIKSLKGSLQDHRKGNLHLFQHEGKVEDAIFIENLKPSLINVYLQQVETCYEKVQVHKEIASLANKDGLTKLYNHRYFQERLRQEISQAKRQKSFVSFLLMDIDHFKTYNDQNGHPAGDKLLKQLAELLTQHGEDGKQNTSSRVTDIVARYGGEEFVMILPFTPYDGAKIKAERIRKAVEEYPFEHREKQELKCISLSIGIATFPDSAKEPAELIEAADRCLYQAKHEGRNRVVGDLDSKTKDHPSVDESPQSGKDFKAEAASQSQEKPQDDLEPPAKEEVAVERPEETIEILDQEGGQKEQKRTLGNILEGESPDTVKTEPPSPEASLPEVPAAETSVPAAPSSEVPPPEIPKEKKKEEDLDANVDSLVAAIESVCVEKHDTTEEKTFDMKLFDDEGAEQDPEKADKAES